MDLKLGHYGKDGIEVVVVQGEIDIYTASLACGREFLRPAVTALIFAWPFGHHG